MEGNGVMPPEKPAHQPGQQQNRQDHSRQAGREYQQIQSGQSLQHRLVQSQRHHHGRRGHPGDHHTHAPQCAAEIIPPEIGLHCHADDFSHIEQAEKYCQRTYRHAHPGSGGPSLLASLPEERGDRSHDQSNKKPGGHGTGDVDGRRNSLGKAQKAQAPAKAQRDKPFPVPWDRRPWMGQCLHQRPVNVKYHRQHAAGDTGQNGSRSDQHTAQQIPQPAFHKAPIPFPPQRRFLHLFTY